MTDRRHEPCLPTCPSAQRAENGVPRHLRSRRARRRTVVLTVLAALSLALTAPVSAHEYWLTMSDLAPRLGQTVEIGAAAGTGFKGEAKLWDPQRAVEFAWHIQRRFSLTPMAPEGETRWGWFTFPDTTGLWVQYQSNFVGITLAGAAFDAYLQEEGLDGPLAARRKAGSTREGRERYRRCAKAWVDGTSVRRAQAVLGQPLELVPQSRPGAEPSLRVRLLWQGKPLAGALVHTYRQPLGDDGRVRPLSERDSVGVAEAKRTDAHGQVVLSVAEPGEWLVSVVHMVASADAAADWESTWASLTFVRRAPAQAEGRPAW
ncbi:MAG: DUF4198 domain-containing protein [Candidatus Eisenbacteria bacterium]